MLWLGVHLPQLSLASWLAELDDAAAAQPLALQGPHRLLAVNPAAAAAGVAPGMKRATALALCPTLRLGPVDPARDARALQAAAHRLMRFTPTVVALPPQGLLAELQPSQRCFGGLAALADQLRQDLAALAQPLQLAWAPGAQAAAWLARWQPDPTPPAQQTRALLAPVPRPGQPHSPDAAWAEAQRRLEALPATVLVSQAAQAEALQAMGLATVADWRAQPRAGLTRRFGAAPLAALDRAWGLLPDPREPLRPPQRFADALELHGRTDDATVLLEAATRLFERMAAWARALQARVGRFTLEWRHESRLRASAAGPAGAHASRLTLALAQPSADPAHWRGLLRERLAREPLAAPVLGLALSCDEPVAGAPPPSSLFADLDEAGHEGLLRLLERLQARLGDEGVARLQAAPEHRPEQASAQAPWRPGTAAGPVAPPGLARPDLAGIDPAQRPRLSRPAWLLEPPSPLAERQGRPWLAGEPLRLLAGPERIETGWWDEAAAARDYFVAQAPSQALVWVYRLRPAPPPGEPGWFLHGRFG